MNANIFSLLRNKDKLYVEREIKSGKYDLNTVDSSGYSPILLAAVDGNEFAIELLIREGVSFSDGDRPDKATWDPLHLAAAKGHLNVVKQLIAFGANVNAKDYRGNTPLGCALAAGYSNVFETLLLNGADLNLIANNAANLALKSLSLESLRAVLDFGFEFQLFEEGTAFHYIIERDYSECCHIGCNNSHKFIEVFDYLMEANTRDIDTEYADKGTPLTLAFTRRRHHFSSRLVKFGADVTNCDLTRFRFSSDAITSLKYLFYSGFRFNLNYFRNNCHPLTPDHNSRRELEINCRKLSCSWLTDDEYNNEKLSFHQFCKWIEMQTTTPPTLKTAARIAVRKAFRTFTRKWVLLNKVPQSLQNYILLNDV